MSLVIPAEPLSESTDRFWLDPERPLPDLDVAGSKAFVAVDRDSNLGSYFGLICDLTMPVRYRSLIAMRGAKLRHTLCPEQFGPVPWKPAGRRVFAIVFDRPGGGRLAKPGESIPRWTETQVINDLITPVNRALAELEAQGLTHRSIRPANLFYRDAARRQIMLGDCVTTVPALLQPIVFEPVEGMMAPPQARSLGAIADDLYALGVTVITVLRGTPPCPGISDGDLLRQKLREGSFETLTRGMEISPNLTSFLRGVLNDNPPARWTIAEISAWLAGQAPPRRVVPPLPGPVRKMEFMGEPIPTMRMLGYLLADMPTETAVMIREKVLEAWLIRAYGTREAAGFVTGAIGGNGERPPTDGLEEPWLVARVCIALDPYAPIRFGERVVAADAVGTCLAIAMLKGSATGARQMADLLRLRLPAYWLTLQTHPSPGVPSVIFGYDPVKRMIENETIGFGIERVAYELVPDLRCLSPWVEAEFILEAEDLLPALERALIEGRVTGVPIDRHIAAFIGAHAVGRQDDKFMALTHPDQAERGLAALKLFVALKGAALQPILPRLTQLLANETAPMLNRVHNRALRARLEARLVEVAPGGNLLELLKLVNDTAGLKQDTTRFMRGRSEFRYAATQLEKVNKSLTEIGIRSQALGDVFGYWFCVMIVVLFGIVTFIVSQSR